VAFIFWVATMGDKAKKGPEHGQPAEDPTKIPGGVSPTPAMAGGSLREQEGSLKV